MLTNRVEKLFDLIEKLDIDGFSLSIPSLDNSTSFVIEYTKKFWRIKPQDKDVHSFKLVKNYSEITSYLISRHLNIEKAESQLESYLADLFLSMNYKSKLISDSIGEDVIKNRECRQDMFRDCNIDIHSSAEKEIKKKRFSVLSGDKK